MNNPPDIEFLQTDLTRCQKLADSVLLELTKHSTRTAQAAFAQAESGYARMTLMLPQLEDASPRAEIMQKLTALRTQLDELQNEFSSLKY